MSNELVKMLATEGFIGKGRAISRRDAARRLQTTIRNVQAWAEESRNAGVPTEIVGYTSAGKRKGMFLASGSDEIKEMKDKVTREAKVRLRQRRGLQRALSAVQPNTVFPQPPELLKQGEIFSTEGGAAK